ncbi:hypothetical protein K788_0009102 [Paraburkholderia caribensis MBA4]|uniref:Uncharacterized protein n=1 Tax=Paraburkholderia caribensis MBA4 TaxID=1323664 RepID=A0A0P0RKL9_9BURK|nr:hypothetical protein K788_0009102 [Paraburkholderia caribensis MBA4]
MQHPNDLKDDAYRSSRKWLQEAAMHKRERVRNVVANQSIR